MYLCANLLFRFALFCALFFAPCLSNAADAASDDTAAVKKEALSLLKSGKFLESYELFMALLRENPLDGDVNLGVARSAYAARRYNQAIMAYERLMDSYPDKAFLPAETARAYLGLGNIDTARYYFDMAMKMNPSIREEDINALVKRAEESVRKFFMSGRAGVSFLYDSNANSGPLSRSIVLGDWKLLLSESDIRKEAFGMTGSASFNFMWRGDPGSRLVWVADASVFGKLYMENAVKDNNFIWGRAAAGLRYSWKRVYADFRVKSDFAQYPSDKNITSLGAEALIGVVAAKDVSLTTRLSYDWRFYGTDSDNDGGVFSAGQYARISFGEHALVAGGKFLSREAQVRRLSYIGAEVSVKEIIPLPLKFSVVPSFVYKAEWYGAPGTALEKVKRKDDQFRLGFSVTKYFGDSLSVGAEYNYINNSSTSNLYRYEQHTAELSATWYF